MLESHRHRFLALVSSAALLLLTSAAFAQLDGERGTILEKTVGTTPNTCSTETDIVVAPGTEVYYCYSSPFNTTEKVGYNLTDDILGLIEGNGILAPSETIEVIIPSTIFTNVTNIAELFVYELNATNPKYAFGNASATVFVDPSLGGGGRFSPAIPTLSEIALFSFGVLLIGGAFLVLRRTA